MVGVGLGCEGGGRDLSVIGGGGRGWGGGGRGWGGGVGQGVSILLNIGTLIYWAAVY